MSSHDQIREAFAELAGRTSPPERVAAGIAGRRRAIVRRRLLLSAGGGVAAAAALGVPAALMWPRTPSTVEELLAPVWWRGHPMPFTPTWLPEGFRLTSSMLTTSRPGPQRREWHPNPPDINPSVRLDLKLGAPAKEPSSEAVAINGAPGWISHNDFSARCTWQPFAGVTISVSYSAFPTNTDMGPAYAELALRIARSTSLRSVEYLRPTLSFGWLPPDPSLRQVFERYSWPDAGGDAISAVSGEGWRRAIGAALTERAEESMLKQAQQTTVRGRPGWYRPADPVTRDGATFVVQLADGRWLSTGASIDEGGPVRSKEDLARITETIKLE